MKREDSMSEEQLNAFTDGELDSEEKDRLFGLSETSPELEASLCQQRRLKEMVQHAYRDVPEYNREQAKINPDRRILGMVAAAVLVLAVGMIAGFIGSRFVYEGSGGAMVPAAQVQQQKWLLHLTSSEPEKMEAALIRARFLMNDPDAPESRQVEIVANERGLDLLRSDVTPFAAEIRDLAERDVLFFACARAIERLESEGIDVKLVPEAEDRYSALDRVVLRMNEGWKYEKI